MAWIDAKQVILASGPDDKAEDGPTYRAACDEFRRLTRSATFGPTFAEVSQAYQRWYNATHPASSSAVLATRLKPVVEAFGSCYARQCRASDIEVWCAKQRGLRGWSSSTVRLTMRFVEGAFSHASREGTVPAGQLGRFRLPPEVSRSEDVVLSASAEAAVLANANSAVRDFCVILRDTGCRPGEARRAEAKHFRPHLRALVFPAADRDGAAHKTGAKTGEARVIFLQGESLALVERLCVLHPTGALFRRRAYRGIRRPWTNPKIAAAFAALRERSGVRGLIAYSFRHTFAVRWLTSGRSSDTLAILLGTSRTMIDRHYGHLASQRDYLREMVDELERENTKVERPGRESD